MRRAARWVLLAALPLGAAEATPPPDSVEGDAQEYTRLVMQHDHLLLKTNMHRASAAEQEEMVRAGVSAEAIKAKYKPGRVQAAVAAAFSRRILELSREVIAPAVKRWVVEAFPEPDGVAAGFSDDFEQAAAMQVLAQLLAQKIGQPPIPESTAKIDRYRSAWAKLNPQSRPDYGTRLDKIDALRRSKEFALRVVERVVPLYGNEVGNSLRKERFETAVVSDTRRYYTAVATVLGILIALPILFLAIGEGRFRRRLAASGKWFDLPPELDEVRVFRKRYPVAFRGGLITRGRALVTKEHVSRFTPGSETMSGRAEFYEATHTHTEYEVTIERPDGNKTDLTLHVLDLPPDEGQLYSVLLSGKTIVLTYNHSKGVFHPRTEGIRDANRMRGFLLWLGCMAVSAVGFLGIDRFLVSGSAMENPLFGANLRTMIVMTAPLAGLYIGLLKMAMMGIRVRQFNAHWAPRFESFMAAETRPLEEHFKKRMKAV